MKKEYLVNYWKPQRNPHICGYYYDSSYKEIIETNNIKKEIERIKKEVESFKTSIYPSFRWEFILVDVKEI